MTPARQETLVQGLNGVAKKVYECVPIAETWRAFQVMAAMRHLTGSTPDAQIVSGCLTKLVDAGLIKKTGRDAYQRRAVEQKQKPKEPIMTVVATKPAPQVDAKPASTPLDLIGELASDIAAAGESLKRLAKRAEDVALMVEQDREANEKAMAGYRQLKALLKDCAFGIKYETNALGEAEKAWYLCEHNACVLEYHEAVEAANDGRWICERTGLWTRDSMDWFKADGEPARTPRSVTFHIWTAYSVFTTWLDMVGDWLNVKGDREKLITFVNTTLGETWEGDQGEKLEWENLYGRREIWQHMPARVAALTGFIDTQDDRYEARIWAWAAGEEGWLVDRWILQGDPGSAELRRKVGLKLHQQYQREDGVSMRVALWGWDSGGHYTDEVYEESKKHGLFWVIPTKGHNVYGKPIAIFPDNKSKAGVYLTMIGTDNAKELIYSRLKLQPEPGKVLPGVMHLPANDAICDENELKQLTAETKVMKIEKGQYVADVDMETARNVRRSRAFRLYSGGKGV